MVKRSTQSVHEVVSTGCSPSSRASHSLQDAHSRVVSRCYGDLKGCCRLYSAGAAHEQRGPVRPESFQSLRKAHAEGTLHQRI